jgi:hypothetical protein
MKEMRRIDVQEWIGAGLLVIGASTSCLALGVPAVAVGLWLVVSA